jgi:hypothetical protein
VAKLCFECGALFVEPFLDRQSREVVIQCAFATRGAVS